jgi:hypothetical protein
MTSLDPHNSFGTHKPNASSWLGITVAFFTVLLVLVAILLD